ncbi:hypothetical protein NKH18_51615 [Streptomyces sp. M10(2022)]
MARAATVGDVLPGGEQGAGGDHGGVWQVDVLVGGRGHQASPSSSVGRRPARRGGPGRFLHRCRAGAGRAGLMWSARLGMQECATGRRRGRRDEVRQRQVRQVGVGGLGEYGPGLGGGQGAEPLRASA